jgi:hypothetical protein
MSPPAFRLTGTSEVPSSWPIVVPPVATHWLRSAVPVVTRVRAGAPGGGGWDSAASNTGRPARQLAGVPFITAIGGLFIPAAALAALPSTVQLILGTALFVVLELALRPSAVRPAA